MAQKSWTVLKKYKQVISPSDYQVLKKDLKILKSYRKHTEINNDYMETYLSGDFFICDREEDFEYFKKNEILKEEK